MIKRIGRDFVDWCCEVVNSDDYVLLDTETTGLGNNDQIIELSIINRNGHIVWDGLIKPTCLICDRAMQVHRITEEMVSDVPSFADQWEEIEENIAGRKIITWNAAFDARMIQQTAMAHKIILKDIDFYCAMLGYTDFYQEPGRYNGYRWQKLEAALSQQGIDLGAQQHRALWDAQATLEIIRAMAKKAEGWQNWGDVAKSLEG